MRMLLEQLFCLQVPHWLQIFRRQQRNANSVTAYWVMLGHAGPALPRPAGKAILISCSATAMQFRPYAEGGSMTSVLPSADALIKLISHGHADKF